VLAVAALPTKILVVDADPAVGNLCQLHLRKHNISVLTACDLSTALYHFNQNKFDVVLVEMNFRQLSGLAIIQKWRKHEFIEKRHTGFIVMLGSRRTSGQDELAFELADIEMSAKPIQEIQLLPLLARAVQSKKAMREFNEIKERAVMPSVKAGNIAKALECVNKLIPEYGDRARRLILEVYESASCWAECLDVALKMLESNPKDVFLIGTVGRMYMKMGKVVLAKQYMEKADFIAPKNIERVSTLANIYLKTREPIKSAGKYKELIDLSPESPSLKFEAMKKIYDEGFSARAIDFGKQVSEPSEAIKHYNNKGVILSKEGKMTEAIEEYSQALRFFPNYKQNYLIFYNMALAYLKIGTARGSANARTCLQKCLELDPSFEKAKQKLNLLMADSAQKS